MAGSDAVEAAEDPARTLHARLVSCVRARAAQGSGFEAVVSQEHSYARPRQEGDERAVVGGPLGGGGRALDVCQVEGDRPLLPGDQEIALPQPELLCDGGDEDKEDWEWAVCSKAPSAGLSRAVRAVCRLLSALWLRRAAGSATRLLRREEARHAARKLRHIVSPLWLSGGGGAASGSGAHWLITAVSSHAPPELRVLLDEVVAELRALVPRLAGRLPPGGVAGPPPCSPPTPPGPPAPPDARPLLCWAAQGCTKADQRWTDRLATLLDIRVLTPSVPSGGGRRPDEWAAAVAGSCRRALLDALGGAGPRGAVLGGAGGGAALAVALATALGDQGEKRGLRGLALLAPPPVTAEGPLLLPGGLPTLVVTGGAGGGWQAMGARRTRLLPGADHALRLPAKRAQLLRLPQRAIDAAIVEEVSQWCSEISAREPDNDEEYAHLPDPPPLPSQPAPSPPAPQPAPPPPLVSRVSGSTPLPLLAPRRAPPPAPLAPADILQLPIVFADDTSPPTAPTAPAAAPPPTAPPPTAPPPDDGPITVTSGNARKRSVPVGSVVSGGCMGSVVAGAPTGSLPLQYRRVIVASRARRAPPLSHPPHDRTHRY